MTAATVAKDAGWTIAERVVAALGQILLLLLAARLAGPDAMGLFALASAIAAGMGILAIAGWGEHVASNVEDDAALRAGQAAALSAGLATTAAGVSIGLGIELFWRGPSAFGTLLALLSIGLVPQAVVAPVGGRLIGTGRLVDLARLNIVSDVVAAVVGFGVLFAGYPIAGLVLTRLVKLFLICVLIHVSVGVRPLLRPRLPDRALVSFSGHVLASRLLGWATSSAPLFIVGLLMGPAAAGVFRVAMRLASALGELVIEPARRMAWSRFVAARARGPEALARSVESFSAGAFAIASPVFVGLACTASLVVNVGLGPEWAEAGPLLALMALANLFLVTSSLSEPSLTVAGSVRLVPRLRLFAGVVQTGGIVAATPFGLVGIGGAILVAQVIAVAARLWVEKRAIAIDVGASIRSMVRPAAAGIGMAAILLPGLRVTEHLTDLHRLAILVPAGAATWLALIGLLYPREAAEALRQIRRLRPEPGR